MSLIPCKECKREVSNQAVKCPHCGAPIGKSEGMKILRVLAWMALLFMAVESFLSYVH